MDGKYFSVTLELRDGYEFVADFEQEGVQTLLVDEPPPLGAGSGPNAARLLAAAVAQCLSASALFCLRKARIDVSGMRTTVSGEFERDGDGRLRIGEIKVRIEPEVAEADIPRMRRCLEVFEDYCTVTQSVRRGIAVDVDVQPKAATPVPDKALAR